MKHIIHTTVDTPFDELQATLQQAVEDAATAQWLRQTRPPLPNPAMVGYVNLSGETIYETTKGNEDA